MEASSDTSLEPTPPSRRGGTRWRPTRCGSVLSREAVTEPDSKVRLLIDRATGDLFYSDRQL
jgi:hypothetical protein